MSGTLYLVPTPIGNLEDITLRALRILKEVALIACEDTRTSRILLKHYDILTPLTSYHEHNKLAKLDALFIALESGDVAVISDAGTPGLSDPGFELVREAVIRGYRVEALPGANAVLPALTASGLPTDTFIFLGFLPRKGLKDLFTALAHVRRTLIAYESPNRLADSLQAARNAFGGDRPCCVAREISKKFEEYTRGTIDEVLKRYGGDAPRGEIVVLFGPAPEPSSWDEARVRAVSEQYYGQNPRFNAVSGTAESTSLPDACVDMATAGQAFHWFNHAQARVEFARILKPGGWIALLWNDRVDGLSPFMDDFNVILNDYDIEKATTARAKDVIYTDMDIAKFYDSAGFEKRQLDNPISYTWEQAVGRALSASYAPLHDHPTHADFVTTLRAAFDAHQRDGVVWMHYITQVYYGRA